MRDRDGAEIEALFADELAWREGAESVAHFGLLIAAVWDIARRAPYEHWRRRGRHRNEESPMRSILADLRFAVRSFSRQPGPTRSSCSRSRSGSRRIPLSSRIVDGLFLRPFPFPEAGSPRLPERARTDVESRVHRDQLSGLPHVARACALVRAHGALERDTASTSPTRSGAERAQRARRHVRLPEGVRHPSNARTYVHEGRRRARHRRAWS